MLPCPRCGTGLEITQRGGQSVRACARCGGLWMTGEELGAIVEDWEPDAGTEGQPGEQAGLQVPLAEVEEHLRCTACGEPMGTFNYASDSGIILSRCSRCSAVWLDRGELELVARWASASRRGLDRDAKRFSADLRHEEVRQDALEQQDSRPGVPPAGPVPGDAEG